VDIVSVFRSRPALRWLVPSAAAVVIIGGGAAAGTIVASADPSLPDRSAAQLLVDVQNAKVAGFSGTIVESADLGLPDIAKMAGASGGALSSGALSSGALSSAGDQGIGGLTRLIAGSNTARVWYAGEDKVRLALMGTTGETDVIRNGTNTWLWNSSDKTATHLALPKDAGKADKAALPAGVPQTPQEAADAALAAITPTTTVATTGAAKVAGRDAYELVLSPKDASSLVGQVRLAIDAETHIPLRVDVYAKSATSPAVRVAFQQISFTTPDAQQFTFNPPAGTKVTEQKVGDVATDRQKALKERMQATEKAKPAGSAEPKVIGKGWTSIVTAKLPAGADTKSSEAAGVLGLMEKVSGTWGSGHEYTGTLFSVLVTDDGRVFAGAVTADALYQAAAK
jgi:outer membrane lipoprotein-sorting protein